MTIFFSLEMIILFPYLIFNEKSVFFLFFNKNWFPYHWIFLFYQIRIFKGLFNSSPKCASRISGERHTLLVKRERIIEWNFLGHLWNRLYLRPFVLSGKMWRQIYRPVPYFEWTGKLLGEEFLADAKISFPQLNYTFWRDFEFRKENLWSVYTLEYCYGLIMACVYSSVIF